MFRSVCEIDERLIQSSIDAQQMNYATCVTGIVIYSINVPVTADYSTRVCVALSATTCTQSKRKDDNNGTAEECYLCLNAQRMASSNDYSYVVWYVEHLLSAADQKHTQTPSTIVWTMSIFVQYNTQPAHCITYCVLNALCVMLKATTVLCAGGALLLLLSVSEMNARPMEITVRVQRPFRCER